MTTTSDGSPKNLLPFCRASPFSANLDKTLGRVVVRSAVEQIGGRVTLDSRVGQGATVRLDVPMNIAMSRIMVVECAGQTFGIPMDHVAETVRLTPDRIRGRIFSFDFGLATLSFSISILLGGWIADQWGALAAIGVLAGISGAWAIAWTALTVRIRRESTFEQQPELARV